MKILAINGSHRGQKGHTQFLLDLLAKGIVSGGGEFEAVTLAEKKINHCLSCGKCNSKDHYLKCVHEDKDDMKSVLEKMAGADILVFATPIYIFTMTGLFKNFLDRLYSTGDVFDLQITRSGMFFHHIDKDVCSKPLVSLICCDNTEAETPKNVVSYFRTYAKFHDAPLVGELVRNAGRFAGHGKDPGAPERAPKLKQAYAAFERAGLELATEGRISRATQRTAAQNILPIPPHLKPFRNLRPIKMKMLQQARRMSFYREGDV
jgi:multimeric flavodoxin WrbA